MPDAIEGVSVTRLRAEDCDARAVWRLAPSPMLRQGAEAATPRAVVVFVHGFLRSPAQHQRLATRLAREGMVVLLPDLDSPLMEGASDRDMRHVLAVMAAETPIANGTPVFLGGFSRGGGIALSAALAAVADGRQIAGIFLVDPVISASLVQRAAAPGIPLALVTAPPSACNAHGRAFAAIREQLRPVLDRTIAGASHCDAEDPSDIWCALTCGAPDRVRQKAFEDVLAEFVMSRGRR